MKNLLSSRPAPATCLAGGGSEPPACQARRPTRRFAMKPRAIFRLPANSPGNHGKSLRLHREQCPGLPGALIPARQEFMQTGSGWLLSAAEPGRAPPVLLPIAVPYPPPDREGE
jgi:hypothetical protein